MSRQVKFDDDLDVRLLGETQELNELFPGDVIMLFPGAVAPGRIERIRRCGLRS